MSGKEPVTIQEGLREVAELAMKRGDLLTRGDCYMGAMVIDRLSTELATAQTELAEEKRLRAEENLEYEEEFKRAEREKQRGDAWMADCRTAQAQLKDEQNFSNQIANAWQREICQSDIKWDYHAGHHWIDFMVMATRQMMALAVKEGVSCCGMPELCSNQSCNNLLRHRLEQATGKKNDTRTI